MECKRTRGRAGPSWALFGAITLLTVAAVLPAVPALAADKRHFDVPAGPATSTLVEFGRQADLSILYDYRLLRSFETRAVRGDLEPLKALEAMLDGTGLVLRYVNEKTVTVEPGMGQARLREQSHHRGESPARGSQPVPIVSVFGTLAQNEVPAPVGTSVTRLTRDDIERAGAASTPDLLRTLPQNFGGGPSEDTYEFGREARTNSGLGDGVNLRGLDSGSTLVLVNGRRLAPSGTAGTFTDISNIPLTAIDHVDVLPDGASILYGGDAIGGIVNVVLRDDATVESEARVGGFTAGAIGQRRFNQSLGARWDSGSGRVSFEYYERDALWAADRRLATSDLTAFGGQNFDTPAGNPGTILAGGTVWAIPRGQDGTALKTSQLVAGTENLYDRYHDATILPRQELMSLLATGRQNVGDTSSLFLDALLNHRVADAQLPGVTATLSVPAGNPFYVNPAGGSSPVSVLYGFGDDLGPNTAHARIDSGQVALGIQHDTPRGWGLQAYLSHAFERQDQLQEGLVRVSALLAALRDPNPSTAFDAFGDGSHTNPATLAAIRSEGRFTLDSRLELANISAAGPIATLPGGPLAVRAGADFRRQSFDESANDPTQVLPTHLARDVSSGFAEARLPLVEKLELSAAVRYEHYSDVGGVLTRHAGLAFSPGRSITLRGTWSRLFRAPNLPDLSEVANVSTTRPLADPTSPTGPGNTNYTNALIWAGSNADLKPATAESWTVGLDLAPPAIPRLSLALTFFNTRMSDRVDQLPGLPLNVLSDPGLSWAVTRNPTAAEREAVCQRSRYFGAAPDCLTVPVGALVDIRLHNVATLATQGIDLRGAYEIERSHGRFRFGVDGTCLLQYAQAVTPESPLIEQSNTQHNPVRLRLRGSVSWDYRGFSSNAFVNYQGDYRDTASVPNRRVGSWTTLDMVLRYSLPGDRASALNGIDVSLATQNVFNTDPPFLNNQVGIGYDQENGDLLGRLVSFTVRKRWW